MRIFLTVIIALAITALGVLCLCPAGCADSQSMAQNGSSEVSGCGSCCGAESQTPIAESESDECACLLCPADGHTPVLATESDAQSGPTGILLSAALPEPVDPFLSDLYTSSPFLAAPSPPAFLAFKVLLI